MLLTVYVPLLRMFYPEANGNWDAAIMYTLLAIGVFCEDRDLMEAMMNYQSRTTTAEAEDYLEALADELEIPESRYAEAERSYKSLGGWLNRENSSIRAFGPEVYSQGSFALAPVTAAPWTGLRWPFSL